MKNLHRHIVSLAAILVLGTLFPVTLLAATAPAGVPKDALWFSKEPFFAGETITVFTVVYNSTDYRLSGTMELRDGTTTLAKKDFIVETLGASQIVSFPWTVTAGSHLFSAVITQDELRKEGGVLSDQSLAATKTTGAKRFADLDTDHDGLGNIMDTDDDGDGLMDAEEKKLKTDPLNPDTDGDGISDKKDAHPLTKDKVKAATTTPLVPVSAKNETVTLVEETMKTTLPEPIVSKAVPILGAIEDFRTKQAGAADDSVHALIKTIAIQTGATTSGVGKVGGWSTLGKGVTHGDIAKSPFQYVKLFFALIWNLATSSVYIFYILILLILFKLVRALFRLFF
jgi:hypothetical protein